jgi:CTP synthase (UTP-ammonia lyase)
VPIHVAVIGDRVSGAAPQDAIAPALAHAAASLGLEAPTVRWVGTEQLERRDPGARLGEADGIWCAPGSPYRSFTGALAGIRFARERGVPFIGTCAGFQHAVIEVARHLAGISTAEHEEYGREGGDLMIHELLCSLVGQRLEVLIDDPAIQVLYGADWADETYYCRFGLNPVYIAALEAAGLQVAGVDVEDGQPRIMCLDGHPFFVITLFVPQTSSSPGAPHPLVRGFLAAAARVEPAAAPS